MSNIRLDIVTAEQVVFSDDVDVVVAPGVDGELGVLPQHAPLMTMLAPGELLLRKGGEETVMAITGGYIEVRPDHIIVLADAAERADEIDMARAEEAKKRAEERLGHVEGGLDAARAEAALRRSMVRLKVAEKRRKRRMHPGI